MTKKFNLDKSSSTKGIILPTAKKRFGQNFLTDHVVIDHLLAAICPHKSDQMLEIGPGCAALTAPLMQYLQHLYAIEIDRDLTANLTKKFAQQITVFNQDILQFNFAQLNLPDGELRVVGNLPYNISTPILFHLLQYNFLIKDIHVMLQKEVVKRIVALPSDSEYGRLSVMCQYYFACELLFTIPPEAFTPQPKVTSAFLRLTPKRAEELPADSKIFANIVKVAFANRRKMLRNNLTDYFQSAQLEDLGIDPQARAESLEVSDYINMAHALAARQD